MNTTKLWNSIATTCLLSGALVLTGCGSSSDDSNGGAIVGDGGLLEFGPQPVSVAHALKGSDSDPFNVTAKDSSGNVVDYDGKVKLEILNKESNTATELGIFDMTDGLLNGQVVPLTGANGNTVITATLVNSEGESQSNVFESNAFELVENSQLNLHIHSLNRLANARGFDATVYFVSGATTTPVHGANHDVTVEVVERPTSTTGELGDVVSTNPDKPITKPAVNGIATYSAHRCTVTGYYTYRFTSTVDGRNIVSPTSQQILIDNGG